MSQEKKKREPRPKETWRKYLKMDFLDIDDPEERLLVLISASGAVGTFFVKWFLGKTMKQWLNYVQLSLDQLIKYVNIYLKSKPDEYPSTFLDSLQIYQIFKTQKTQTMTSTERKQWKERLINSRNKILDTKVSRVFKGDYQVFQEMWTLINPNHAALRLVKRIEQFRNGFPVDNRIKSNPKSNHTMTPWPYARAELYQKRKS
jgi:hypothetical protein